MLERIKAGLHAVAAFLRRYLVVVFQGLLFIAGLVGAYLRAFPIQKVAEKENVPVVDAVTLAWLGLCLLAVLLPKITEVTLGDLSLKLRQAEEGAQNFEGALDDAANLAQNWSSSVMIYIDLLDNEKDQEKRGELLNNYLRDRMGEAKTFLGDHPDSLVRIALWIQFEPTGPLEFYFSNEFIPNTKSYQPGQGLMGQAFLEDRSFNEQDIRTAPSYVPSRSGDPPYRAVLCVPVKQGRTKIGMLTVDKQDATYFKPIACEIAKGLAAQCAIALDQYQRF